MPDRPPSAATIDGLKTTLQQVEQQSGLTPDDSSLVELKRILLGKIAELEAEKLFNAQSTALPPAAILEAKVLHGGEASGTQSQELEIGAELRDERGPDG